MSWKGTILLLLLAGLALGFLLFSGRTRTHPPQEPLLGIDPSIAESIQIQEGGSLIRLISTNGVWMIEKDEKNTFTPTDRADPQLIQSLLETITDIIPLDILRSSEFNRELNLASLGLKQKTRSISIHAGKRETLWIGTEGAAPGSLYARLGSGKTVYLISGKIASLAFRPIQEYRDPRLTRLSSDHINEVSVAETGTMGQQLSLGKDSKTRQSWLLKSPLIAGGDDKTINSWLDSLLGSRVSRWMPEETDSASCGLDTPWAVITLHEEGTAQPVTISIGSPVPDAADSFFIRCSDRPGICVVGGLGPFLAATPQALRSKKITQVEYDAVDKIEILDDHHDPHLLSLTRKPGSDDWLLAAGTDVQPLPGEKVKVWFDKLQNLRAIRFEAATAEHLNYRGLGPHTVPTVIRLIARLSENTAQENAGETVLAQYIFGNGSKNEVALREVEAPELLILPAGSTDFLNSFFPASPSSTPETNAPVPLTNP